jgi:hypothetical protein
MCDGFASDFVCDVENPCEHEEKKKSENPCEHEEKCAIQQNLHAPS